MRECRGPNEKRAENTRVVDPLRRPIPRKWTGNRTAPPDAQLRISPGSVASRIGLQRRLGNTVEANAAPVESVPSRRASSRTSTAGLHSGVYAVAAVTGPRLGQGRSLETPTSARGFAPGSPLIWRYSASTQVVRLPMGVGPPASLAGLAASAAVARRQMPPILTGLTLRSCPA